MGAMVAVVNKEGENAVGAVVSMLKELRHRGGDAHGIGSPTSLATGKSLDELDIEEARSNVVLGHNLSRLFPKEPPQPLSGNGFTFVFEGRLFPSPKEFDAKVIAEKLKSNPERNAEQIIKKLKGAHVFAVAQRDKITVGRDRIGTRPLYYGENSIFSAVASERKALWKLDVTNVKSFPPGNLATLTRRGFSFKPVETFRQPRLKSVNMKNAAKHLQKLLLHSACERVSKMKRVAVAFSGGLDSSLIAVLAKMCEVEVHLISVGLKGSGGLRHARRAAEALDLPFHLQTYAEKDVEKVLPKVLWLIEEPEVVKASIAVPMYWSAESASKLGFQVLLAGHGGDELFGGYHKYLREYAKAGSRGVQKAIYHDVAMCYETNFQRDDQVCSYHKVELRLPFADRDIVDFALSLPVNLKVKSSTDSLRKHVLRQAAQNLGVPSFIVNKRKKAIQYSTGVNKALRKLAKKEELNLREYVKKIFRRVFRISEVSTSAS